VSSSKQNVTVGLFVVVGVALLGVLIVWFGEEPDWLKNWTGGATWRMHISFDDLSYVENGTEVRMAIGRVGQVVDVVFRDPKRPGMGVDVIVEIREDVMVPFNATAIVQPSSMLSRSYVLLSFSSEPVESVPTDGTGRITGEVAGVLDSVVPESMLINLEKATVAIGQFADELTPVARNLELMTHERPVRLVDEPPLGQGEISANLSTAVERFDSFLRNVNTVIGDPETQSQIKDTVTNLHQMSVDGVIAVEEFRELAKETRVVVADVRRVLGNFDQALANADENILRLTSELMQVTDQLDDVIAHIDKASSALTEGEGTAARLFNDPRLYESMVLTFDRLSAAAEEFEKLARQFREKGVKTQW